MCSGTNISVHASQVVSEKDSQALAFLFVSLHTAEDDNFVVWNMLSDKDGPSVRGEEEEEDDYFMDEY